MAQARPILCSLAVTAALTACGVGVDIADLDASPEVDASTGADASLEADAGGVGEDAGPNNTTGGTNNANNTANNTTGSTNNDPGGGPNPDNEELYAPGRALSPLTPEVVARLAAVAAADPSRRDDVFAKIGDSNTVNRNFMSCFASAGASGAAAPYADTVAHFAAGDAGGVTPFERESLAAVVGWSARSAIAGAPNPIAQELSAIQPRFATVMYGTNDIQSRKLFEYADHMVQIVDQLTGAGVIPIVTTIPPRDDSADADAWVPRYNAAARAIAQARQVPLVDLEAALRQLPDHGIGADGLHLTAAGGGCDFSQAGLASGHNTRNLLTISALGALREAILLGQGAPDAPAPRPSGTGTAADPIVVPGLPFSDARDTREGAQDAFDTYTGCAASQDESGPEFVYQLDLEAPATVRAMVFDQGDVDVDLHHLSGQPDVAACASRAHQELTLELEAGTHFFTLDTFVSSGGEEFAGEYVFVLIEE
jgi:hypothetical protein